MLNANKIRRAFRAARPLALLGLISTFPLAASCAHPPTAILRAAPSGNAPSGLPRTSLGGGFADSGLDGEYFADAALRGAPAFTRRDVRIDFDWGGLSPGGSIAEPYKSFPSRNFSVRWTGRLLPRFSETYVFTTGGGLSVALKEPSESAYTDIVTAGKSSGAYKFTAGRRYDVRLEYRQADSPASVRLSWSSPSTPQEVIDPAGGLAINAYTEGFTDAMRAARDEWKIIPAGASLPSNDNAPRDANGWPKTDAGCMIWEGTGGHQGTYLVQFHGQADLTVQFDYAKFSDQKYDPATNVTTAAMTVADSGGQNFVLAFHNTKRTADSPVNTGVTNVCVMTPTSPGATAYFPYGSLFRPDLKKALRRFVALRFMAGTNWNNSVTWTDVTHPDYSTQHFVRDGESGFEGNGMAWEFKVALANETGKDLYVNVPETAGDEYVTKLAQLIKYGSDGHQPYTSPQAHPVYPALNSNLNVYVEFSNEVWNVGFQAFHQNYDAAQAAVKSGTEEGKALTFDGENDGNVLWNRRYALHTAHVSELFRSVWGDGAMINRVRPLLEWQYANYGWPPTGSVEMTFLENYLNNGDGKAHVPTPHPPSYYLWGAGGAAYYNAENEEGITGLIKGGAFEAPTVTGQAASPALPGLTWGGTAGVARSGTSLGGPALPPLSDDDKKAGKPANEQFAYLQGDGSLSVAMKIPVTQTSDVYGIRFRAAQRKKPGAEKSDEQTIDVYLDGTKIDSYRPREDWQTFGSAVFHAAPGSTHTLRLAGAGSADAAAFVDDLDVTSVDAIFAAGLPSNGIGQPAASYQNRLNVTNDLARAYGLHGASYEGGWALGGDAGGTPVQNWGKFNDPRAKAANLRSVSAFYQAGGSLYTFGTYSQWDEWAKADAEPLVQGIDAANAVLPDAPARSVGLPGSLNLSNSVGFWGDKNVDTGRSGTLTPQTLLVWDVFAPSAGSYTVTPTVTGGTAEVLVDGASLTGSKCSLTYGTHTVRLRATGRNVLTVTSVTVEKTAS